MCVPTKAKCEFQATKKSTCAVCTELSPEPERNVRSKNLKAHVVSDVAGVGGLTGINGAGAADGQIIVTLLNISSDKIMLATDGKSAGKQLKHWCEIIVMLPANVNLHRSFDVK